MRPRMRRTSPLLIAVGILLVAGCGTSTGNATDTTASTTTTKAIATTSSTSSASSTSSTSSPSTTVTTAPGSEQPDSAVWPFVSSSTRYTDPVEAATGFATSFLGFVNPIVGDFQQGDTRSGEVAVQTADAGATTTVLVRQLGADDSWWVLGAATPNLQIAKPEALATVTSPLTVSGQSTAFEATIEVEVRADGQTEPVVGGNTMGGSMGEMGPFSIGLSFLPAPTVSGGAIVVKTMSPKDGNIAEATVIRVHF
ncbi:MAG: Gmad2 immunoglobulin-like domain-containing protein [Aquihabitans sp.]